MWGDVVPTAIRLPPPPPRGFDRPFPDGDPSSQDVAMQYARVDSTGPRPKSHAKVPVMALRYAAGWRCRDGSKKVRDLNREYYNKLPIQTDDDVFLCSLSW